jgi:hypothetical protein
MDATRHVPTSSVSPEPDPALILSPARSSAITQLLFASSALLEIMTRRWACGSRCIVCNGYSFGGLLQHENICSAWRLAKAVEGMLDPNLFTSTGKENTSPMEPVCESGGISTR